MIVCADIKKECQAENFKTRSCYKANHCKRAVLATYDRKCDLIYDIVHVNAEASRNMKL